MQDLYKPSGPRPQAPAVLTGAPKSGGPSFNTKSVPAGGAVNPVLGAPVQEGKKPFKITQG